jgi:hypothetical protein
MNNFVVFKHAAEILEFDGATGESRALGHAEKVSVCIEEYKATQAFQTGTYNTLFTTTTAIAADVMGTGVELRVQVEKTLEEGELLFIRMNFSADEIAKESTKGGKIKSTKFLPNDYRSAKSVLLNALESGIPMYDENGEPLGKSALQAGIKASKPESESETESTKSDAEKLDAAMAAVLRYAGKVYGEGKFTVTLAQDTVVIATKSN